jgi:hypothetical protein
MIPYCCESPNSLGSGHHRSLLFIGRPEEVRHVKRQLTMDVDVVIIPIRLIQSLKPQAVLVHTLVNSGNIVKRVVIQSLMNPSVREFSGRSWLR